LPGTGGFLQGVPLRVLAPQVARFMESCFRT